MAVLKNLVGIPWRRWFDFVFAFSKGLGPCDGWRNPTVHFTILKRQSLPIGISELQKIRWWTYFEALNLWDVPSGHHIWPTKLSVKSMFGQKCFFAWWTQHYNFCTFIGAKATVIFFRNTMFVDHLWLCYVWEHAMIMRKGPYTWSKRDTNKWPSCK